MDTSDNGGGPSGAAAVTANGAGAASSTGERTRRHGGEVEALGARSRAQGIEPSEALTRVDTTAYSPAPAADRYEVRDPTSDITYRTNNLADAKGRAEALGSTRLLAIDAEGRRTPLRQVGSDWQKGETLPPRTERPAEAWAQERDGESGTPRQSPTPNAEVTPHQEAVADRAALAARIDAALAERYVLRRPVLSVGDAGIGSTEYRFRGDTSRVAFTASTFKLATQSDQPSVARSMVDLAQARAWKGVRISGSEEFRRMVWMEATVRGMKTQGYEPTPAEQALARREQEMRQTNRIEPERSMAAREDTGGSPSASRKPMDQVTRGASDRPEGQAQGGPPSKEGAPSSTTTSTAQKASGRGSGGGRKAVLAAIEAVLVARGVSAVRREAVMNAATEQLAARAQRGGAAPRVKVYDATAPSRRPAPTRATPEPQRQREQPQPAMARGR